MVSSGKTGGKISFGGEHVLMAVVHVTSQSTCRKNRDEKVNTYAGPVILKFVNVHRGDRRWDVGNGICDFGGGVS